MATTVTAELTPQADTAPAVASVPARERSGAQWVSRFPGSTSLADLEPAFQASATSFIDALKQAGAVVHIAATYRPRERAYLMHYSSMIVRGEIDPEDVPAMNGVNIDWVHDTDAESIQAAHAMVTGFGIVFPPALISRHTERAAVDISITGIIGRTIKDASGQDVLIHHMSDLFPVGASYGARKLVSDPPHWSDNGH